MRYYDSADEVRRRLQNGVILYKREPVYVLEACSVKGRKSRFGVTIRNCPQGDKSWKVPLDDPDLNYRQFRVGFINLDKDVFRVVRYPQRGVQQSLNRHNASVEPLADTAVARNLRRLGVNQLDISTIIQNDLAVECMAGRFPTIEQAREAVETGQANSRAFHYDWCYQRVMGVPALWYKTKPVGLSIDPKSIVKLEDDLRYLKEPLAELGLVV